MSDKTAIGIVGSRYFDDYHAFCDIVTPLLPDGGGFRIVSGGATGVDEMAEMLARDINAPFVEYHQAREPEPSFTRRCHARNQRIVDASDWLIALPGPDSRGTYDTIMRAQKAGKRVIVVQVAR